MRSRGPFIWIDGRRAGVLLAIVMLCAMSGCTTPDAANITLRKQVQSLQDENATLKVQHAGDEASLKARESTTGPAITTLPEDQLDTLFTVHGIRFGRLTGGFDLDPNKPGDDVLKISLIPTDETNDDLKAAGAITIDAFDLAAPDPHIGHWAFTAAQTRDLWNGNGLMYEYILTLPWQTPPTHADVTIKATFVDSLTGRSFTAQKLVTVRPPTTQP